MYKVVLDEKNSYIEPSETGMSFADAVDSILEYCIEAGYDMQEGLWESVKSEGEQNFSSRHQTGASVPIIFA
jgi:hypothetical protein